MIIQYLNRLRRNQHIVIGTVLFFIIFTIWIVYSIFFIGPLDPPSKGDAYGSLNTLFSGLAFGGVILAIIMQGQELKLQRQEMALQREELERTRKEFEELTKTAELQRFENSFFSLLTGLQSLISGLTMTYYVHVSRSSPELKTVRGEEVFYALMHDPILRGTYGNSYYFTMTRLLERANEEQTLSADELGGRLPKAWNNGHPFDSISHYFRYLFRFIYFIHHSDTFSYKYIHKMNEMNAEEIEDLIFLDKYHYTSLIRSYLSENQLILIYMNELNPHFKLMKSFIEEYTLFKNLRPEAIILKNYQDYYALTAFNSTRSQAIRQRLAQKKRSGYDG